MIYSENQIWYQQFCIYKFLVIASGPYPQHIANQLWAFITTAEENLPIMIPENSLIIKLDILCVRKDFQG